MANPAWSTEVDQFYAPKNASAHTWGGKAGSLKSATLKNAAGAKIASVESIVIDVAQGRATLVIVHMEKILFAGHPSRRERLHLGGRLCCIAAPTLHRSSESGSQGRLGIGDTAD